MMLFSIFNVLYHVWAYESELGLRYGDARGCLSSSMSEVLRGWKKEQDTPLKFDLWLDWEVMTSANGLEIVDSVGNDTDIKGCHCAQGEREREKERKKTIFCPKKCPKRNLYFFWCLIRWWKCLKWNVVRVCGCTVERSRVSNIESHSHTVSGWLF